MSLPRIAFTTIAQLKMMFRRRIVLFWSLVFPIILMTLLGLLFGQSINAGTITVIDDAHTPAARAMVVALRHTKGVSVRTDQRSVAHAAKQVRDGDRDALVVLRGYAGGSQIGSGTTRATLYYSNASHPGRHHPRHRVGRVLARLAGRDRPTGGTVTGPCGRRSAKGTAETSA